MSQAAKAAQLLNVMEAIVAELDRQGIVAEAAQLGLDITKLAEAMIEAAEGRVIPFRPR